MPRELHALRPTLARVKRLVSINLALEVELTGQVNAEASTAWPGCEG